MIEKDRDPKWRTGQMEDLAREQADTMMAPLGANEHNLKQDVMR